MWTRSLLAVTCLSALCSTASQEIDAKIYAKIFEVNRPAWLKLAELVAKHVRPDGKVLDVGAGPGEPTLTMAKRMPSHKFILTDKQDSMVQKARKRTVETCYMSNEKCDGTCNEVCSDKLKNVEFHVMPGENFTKFENDHFAGATGCYVLMFVDVKAVLKETHRVLAHGAPAFFAVWKDMSFYTISRKALDMVYKENGWGNAPAFPINPLALSTTEHATGSVEDEVAAVPGLQLWATEEISYDFNLGSMTDTCDATTVLGMDFKKMAKKHSTTAEKIKAAYCKNLSKLVSEHKEWKNSDGSYRLGTGTATIYHLIKTVSHTGL